MKSNNKKKSNYKGLAEIFGTHAVYAALQNPIRKHKKLFISQHQRKILGKDIEKLVPDINELHNSGIDHNLNDFISPSGLEIMMLYRILPRFSWYGFRRFDSF